MHERRIVIDSKELPPYVLDDLFLDVDQLQIAHDMAKLREGWLLFKPEFHETMKVEQALEQLAAGLLKMIELRIRIRNVSGDGPAVIVRIFSYGSQIDSAGFDSHHEASCYAEAWRKGYEAGKASK